MNELSQNNISDGLIVMGSTTSTSTDGAKSVFNSKGCQYLYNVKANITSTVWQHYGFTNTDPHKAVIDRDGNVRGTGSLISSVQQIVEQCVGL